VARPDVTWQGVTETEALRELLGPNGLTEDRTADLVTAVERIRQRQETEGIRHKIVLHALHAELGTWQAVADQLGRPKTTIWAWAHPEGTRMRPGIE
jgi:hypothetical protein